MMKYDLSLSKVLVQIFIPQIPIESQANALESYYNNLTKEIRETQELFLVVIFTNVIR